jgi:nitrogen fixation protein FixH
VENAKTIGNLLPITGDKQVITAIIANYAQPQTCAGGARNGKIALHPAYQKGGWLLCRDKAADRDEIHAVIGAVVSFLLEAGKPLHMHEITAQLKRQAEEASDKALRKICLRAVRLIADKMN